MMQAKCAGIHGSPAGGNHPKPSPNKVLGRAEGPRTELIPVWDL